MAILLNIGKCLPSLASCHRVLYVTVVRKHCLVVCYTFMLYPSKHSIIVWLQIVKGSEVLEVMHGLPDIKQYLFSFYNCQYADFFKMLGECAMFVAFPKTIAGLKICGILVANATMFSHLLPGFSCGSKHFLLP